MKTNGNPENFDLLICYQSEGMEALLDFLNDELVYSLRVKREDSPLHHQPKRTELEEGKVTPVLPTHRPYYSACKNQPAKGTLKD